MKAGKVQHRPMSTLTKAAIGTGIVAAGLTTAAFLRGKGVKNISDIFVKTAKDSAEKTDVLKTITEGYKSMGNKAVEIVKNVIAKFSKAK